ncbi:hypothetical protein SRHO_G00045180 [Serrasalmus rhombeus]
MERTCKLHTEGTLVARPGSRTQAPLAVRVAPEPIPAVIGQKAGYILDRSPVHRRADTDSHLQTHTQGQFSMSKWPDCMSLDCGRKPTQTQGEHANSTQR